MHSLWLSCWYFVYIWSQYAINSVRWVYIDLWYRCNFLCIIWWWNSLSRISFDILYINIHIRHEIEERYFSPHLPHPRYAHTSRFCQFYCHYWTIAQTMLVLGGVEREWQNKHRVFCRMIFVRLATFASEKYGLDLMFSIHLITHFPLFLERPLFS